MRQLYYSLALLFFVGILDFGFETCIVVILMWILFELIDLVKIIKEKEDV